MEKVLIFDVWADYAHFKKPYTTTSPITYSIPSRTTLTGLLGAILGIEKNKNNVELSPEEISIGLKILKPIKKVMVGHNLIDTKTAKYMAQMKNRTQIKFEYIKEPRYRIYVSGGKYYDELRRFLENHESSYTLSLGLAQCLANFEYIGEVEGTLKEGSCEIDSVLPLEGLHPNQVEIKDGLELFSDRFAKKMKEDREVLEYSDVLFERNGKPVSIKEIEYLELSNGENIKFL